MKNPDKDTIANLKTLADAGVPITPPHEHLSFNKDKKEIKSILQTGVATHDALFWSLKNVLTKDPAMQFGLKSIWDKPMPKATLKICVAITTSSVAGANTNLFSLGIGPKDGIFLPTEEVKKELWAYKKENYKFSSHVIFSPELDIVARLWMRVGEHILTNCNIERETDLLAQIYKGHEMVLVLLRKDFLGEMPVFMGLCPVLHMDKVAP